MTDTTHTAMSAPEPVTVTFDLPGRLVEFYAKMTEAGLYLSISEALRQAILSSWRHERGSFLSARVDMDAGDDKPADQAEEQRQGPGPVTEG